MINLEKKPGFNKPLGGDVAFQACGMDLSAKAMKDLAVKAVTENPEAAGLKINAIDVYVKPDEKALYYVARHGKGEVSGRADL